MHILDGVLSTPVAAATSAAAAGLTAYSLVGTKEKEIPKIALMAAVFYVGSLIHVNIGGSSVHLLLSGIIGLMLGRRTPVAIAISLVLQLITIHFGGVTSLGANILDVSIPAMFSAWLVRPFIGKSPKRDFAFGALAGALSVIITVVMVSVWLVESNTRYGYGPFKAINSLMLGHIPIMIIEAVVTGFAVQMIGKTRPEMLQIPAVRRKDR